MFQIVLSLMAGIFIGWNFHLFYSELEKIDQRISPQSTEPTSTSSPVIVENNHSISNNNTTLSSVDLSNVPPSNTTKVITLYKTRIVERNLTKIKSSSNNETAPPQEPSSFEQLLTQGNFSDALAFYMEANEEELKVYQPLMEAYFKEHIQANPKKIIEQIGDYLEIEPNSKEMQNFLAQYCIQHHDLEKAIELFENIHDSFDDENNTLFLAQLYINLEQYEMATQLLEEIDDSSIYHAKAHKLLEDIQQKEKEHQQYNHQIPLQKHDSHYLVNVEIDQIPLRLLLDTGASYTFVDEEKVPSISIEKELLLNTAGGRIIAHLSQVQSFQIGDIELEAFKIATGDFKRSYAEGLLGMDFFKQFDFKIDQNRSMLYLAPK